MNIIYSAAALRDVNAIAWLLEQEGVSVAARFAQDLGLIELLINEQPDAGRKTSRRDTRVI